MAILENEEIVRVYGLAGTRRPGPPLSLTFFVGPQERVAKSATFRRLLACAACLMAITVLLAVGFNVYLGSQAEAYRSDNSPDGRFRVVVYRLPMPVAMPGQSSDAPGFVRLYDQKRGRTPKQSSVRMVQLVDQLEWSSTNLYPKPDLLVVQKWFSELSAKP